MVSVSDHSDAPLTELLNGVHELSYAMGRSQVHERIATGIDVKVERAGFAVLRVLSQGPLRFGVIAERLLVRAPHVTRQVALLEEQGLVQRSQDAADQRAQLVELTDQGRLVVEQYSQAIRERLSRTLDDFPAEHIRIAARVIARMAANSA